MSSDTAGCSSTSVYSKTLEIRRMGVEFDRSLITLPDVGRTCMKAADDILTILQYYVMIFILGVESHLPECHWTHNVLVYLPVVCGWS